jgi:hypothetical protein
MDRKGISPAKNSQAHIVSSQEAKVAAAAQLGTIDTERTLLRFAPEFELLLACSRLSPDREPGLGSILALPFEWDRVLRLAEHHRVLPAIHSSLRGRDDVPASIRSAIRARFERHERKVLRFTAELARILRHFDQLGIQVLAHKGAALAQLLYGDPAMRQFGDLDFLIRQADVPRVRSALQELGYVPKLQLSPRQEKEYLRCGYEYVFGLNAERNLVEVQWQIVPRFYAIDFDMEALFARSMTLDIDGLQVRTLGREDLLLVLCVHAAKHQWSQLGMVCDIAALACLDLDWDWIDGEARRLGIVRIVAVSLWLAHRLFGLELPKQILPECPDAMELSAVVGSRLVTGADPQPESAAYFRSMARLRERRQDRARFFWRLATTPSVGEWQAVPLPDALFPLYRGVRALRLLKRLIPG